MIDMDRLERVWPVRIAVVAAVLAALAVLAYVAWFAAKLRRPVADNAADWGQFGDYVGGTAGTILTAATIALLVISVVVQFRTYRTTKEELRSTSQALADQLTQSRDRAARDKFHATLTLFLSQREYLQKRHTYGIQGSLGNFREHLERGDYVDWSQARGELFGGFHMHASFLSPIVKLLKRLADIAVAEARDVSLLETVGACLDDDELRTIRFLAHFDVPDSHLSSIVTSANAFALVNVGDENKLRARLERYGRPRKDLA